MDGDRKYRQHGYQDANYSSSNGSRSDSATRSDRPRQNGPKVPLDITGPKLPRLVQNVVASRCFNCAVALAPGTDFKGECPKCHAALHCCKQCVHFEPSTRFQCTKAVPVRIPLKDQPNTCELLAPRVTVARASLHSTPAGMDRPPARAHDGSLAAPRNASDARAAFDSLFKK